MKKILYAVMLLLSLSILSSCNKENNGNSGDIIGEWQTTKKEYVFQGSVVWAENYDEEKLAFYDNGSMIHYVSGRPSTYSYVYDTKSGLVSLLNEQWNITLSSSTMVLSRKETWLLTSYNEEKAIMYKGIQIYGRPIQFWYFKDGEKNHWDMLKEKVEIFPHMNFMTILSCI